MMLNWKHRIGATALAVAMLASTGGFPNEAKAVETGQLIIRSNCRNVPSLCAKIDKAKPVDPPAKPDLPTATERGIRDNGVKSHSGGGTTTGRVAAPPPVDDGATPPSTEYGVDGQILEKPPRDRPSARRAHSGPGGTPPSTAKGGKTGWLLGIGGLAAVATIVAVSGKGTPVSR